MKRSTLLLIVLTVLFGAYAAAQQVATAEFQGVDTTLPHTPGVSGWLSDGSIGEATFVVLASDASGKPVAGAPVVWTVMNSADDVAYVVATSAESSMTASAYKGRALVIDGGVTDASGRAFIVLDSLTAGDAKAGATVGESQAVTYEGKDAVRVVWF